MTAGESGEERVREGQLAGGGGKRHFQPPLPPHPPRTQLQLQILLITHQDQNYNEAHQQNLRLTTAPAAQG